MKKPSVKTIIKIFVAVLLIVVLLFSLNCCGFISKAVISKDYETITYNSKTYVRTDSYIEPPKAEDREDFTPHIEGAGFDYYLLPIFWDYVYVSESYPEYIWLETELDTLNGEPFQKYGEIVVYKLEEK